MKAPSALLGSSLHCLFDIQDPLALILDVKVRQRAKLTGQLAGCNDAASKTLTAMKKWRSGAVGP